LQGHYCQGKKFYYTNLESKSIKKKSGLKTCHHIIIICGVTVTQRKSTRRLTGQDPGFAIQTEKIIPTLTDFRISESPDERIRRILIIRIKDDIPQDLPDVELVTDLVSML
jgi:hypothetical protein